MFANNERMINFFCVVFTMALIEASLLPDSNESNEEGTSVGSCNVLAMPIDCAVQFNCMECLLSAFNCKLQNATSGSNNSLSTGIQTINGFLSVIQNEVTNVVFAENKAALNRSSMIAVVKNINTTMAASQHTLSALLPNIIGNNAKINNIQNQILTLQCLARKVCPPKSAEKCDYNRCYMVGSHCILATANAYRNYQDAYDFCFKINKISYTYDPINYGDNISDFIKNLHPCLINAVCPNNVWIGSQNYPTTCNILTGFPGNISQSSSPCTLGSAGYQAFCLM